MFIDRGVDKEDVVHIHNGILLSHKKNEMMPSVATWIQLEITILSEVRKRKTNGIGCYLYEDLKYDIGTYLQMRKRLMNIENRLVVAKGEEEGRGMD